MSEAQRRGRCWLLSPGSGPVRPLDSNPKKENYRQKGPAFFNLAPANGSGERRGAGGGARAGGAAHAAMPSTNGDGQPAMNLLLNCFDSAPCFLLLFFFFLAAIDSISLSWNDF